MDFALDGEGIPTVFNFRVHQLKHPKHVEAHFATPLLYVNYSQLAIASISSL